jgi:hypothetical protein
VLVWRRWGRFSAPREKDSKLVIIQTQTKIIQGAGNFIARPTSRCIMFDGENMLFDSSLVIYSTNIPPVMIINRIYETQTLLSL